MWTFCLFVCFCEFFFVKWQFRGVQCSVLIFHISYFIHALWSQLHSHWTRDSWQQTGKGLPTYSVRYAAAVTHLDAAWAPAAAGAVWLEDDAAVKGYPFGLRADQAGLSNWPQTRLHLSRCSRPWVGSPRGVRRVATITYKGRCFISSLNKTSPSIIHLRPLTFHIFRQKAEEKICDFCL